MKISEDEADVRRERSEAMVQAFKLKIWETSNLTCEAKFSVNVFSERKKDPLNITKSKEPGQDIKDGSFLVILTGRLRGHYAMNLVISTS